MTKKMLVKTCWYDLGGGVVVGGGRTGEERESWCKEIDVNESFCQKQMFFFFLVKWNFHPTS